MKSMKCFRSFRESLFEIGGRFAPVKLPGLVEEQRLLKCNVPIRKLWRLSQDLLRVSAQAFIVSCDIEGDLAADEHDRLHQQCCSVRLREVMTFHFRPEDRFASRPQFCDQRFS